MTARIAVIALALAAIAAAPQPPSQTVSVTLPTADPGPGFKPGPGVELVQRDCLTCHSSAYVRTQPVLNHAAWAAEVAKMRGPYGAAPVIPEADVPGIVDYLTAQYGKP